jgi:hypothetical protein
MSPRAQVVHRREHRRSAPSDPADGVLVQVDVVGLQPVEAIAHRAWMYAGAAPVLSGDTSIPNFVASTIRSCADP